MASFGVDVAGVTNTIDNNGLQYPGSAIFGANLKITTAVYYTPNGRDINKKGIEPAVVVRDDAKTKRDEQLAFWQQLSSNKPEAGLPVRRPGWKAIR